jgi:RNA polymerase sigma-70 factor (ECF subfamily)
VIDLDRLCRAEWGHLLSSLIRFFGDFDLAEEALQEAFAAAVVDWAGAPPDNPRAWLYGTSRHRAIDRIRIAVFVRPNRRAARARIALNAAQRCQRSARSR